MRDNLYTGKTPTNIRLGAQGVESFSSSLHSRNRVGRAHLVKSLYREIGLSLHDAASLVEAVLEEISAAFIQGDTVKLCSFGTFGVKRKKPRMGRNPKTGKEVPIEARKVLVFRASHILKDRINHRITK